MLGRHNPPPTDIPDKDHAAVLPGPHDVRGIKLGSRRHDFADVLLQGSQQCRWQVILRGRRHRPLRQGAARDIVGCSGSDRRRREQGHGE